MMGKGEQAKGEAFLSNLLDRLYYVTLYILLIRFWTANSYNILCSFDCEIVCPK